MAKQIWQSEFDDTIFEKKADADEYDERVKAERRATEKVEEYLDLAYGIEDSRSKSRVRNNIKAFVLWSVGLAEVAPAIEYPTRSSLRPRQPRDSAGATLLRVSVTLQQPAG